MNEYEMLLRQFNVGTKAQISHRDTGDDMFMAKTWFETYGVEYTASDLVEYVKVVHAYESGLTSKTN